MQKIRARTRVHLITSKGREDATSTEKRGSDFAQFLAAPERMSTEQLVSTFVGGWGEGRVGGERGGGVEEVLVEEQGQPCFLLRP